MEGSRKGDYEYLMKLIEKEENEEDEATIDTSDLLDEEDILDEFGDEDYDEIDDIIEESDLKKKIKQLKLNDADQDSDGDSELPDFLQEMGLEKKEVPQASGEDYLETLQSAIQNNRKLKHMLEKLECFLILKYRSLDLLNEEDIEEEDEEECSKNSDSDFYTHFACPYFRDGLFPCPANPDQRVKEINKPSLYMHDAHDMHEIWDSNSINRLDRTIRDLLVEEYVKKENVDHMLREPEYRSAIDKIHILRNHPLDTILRERKIVNLDWEKVSKSMKNPHSPHDCESLWNVYLNPNVNKSQWTSEENSALARIAKAHNLHNWELIAKELNTGRSGYLCFLHYQRELANRTVKWSKEELVQLGEIFEECKVGDHTNWIKLMYYYDCCDFNNLYHKLYKTYNTLVGGLPRRGRFDHKEDRFIMHATKKRGLSIRMVSRLLPSRSSAQIRERLRMLDSDDRRVGGWTEQEDMQLLELVKKHGPRNWALIAKELKDRNRCQVRQHYEHIMKVLRKNPNRSFHNYRSRRTFSIKKGRGKVLFKEASKCAPDKFSKEDTELLKYFAHERKIFEIRHSIFSTYELNRENILKMCELLGIEFPHGAISTSVENKPWKEFIHEAFKFYYKNRAELRSIKSLGDTVTLMPPNASSFNALRNILTRLHQEEDKFMPLDKTESLANSPSNSDQVHKLSKRLLVLFGSSFLLQGLTKPKFEAYLTGDPHPK